MARWLAIGLALALSGCALRPPYIWIADGQVTDWYRWEQIPREHFPAMCGFLPPDGFNAGGACAIRIREGIVKPGDRAVSGDAVAGSTFPGRLCVIVGTMDAGEAKRMLDATGEDTLFDHELRHCRGWVHR